MKEQLGKERGEAIRELVKKAALADSQYQVFGASKHRYQLNPVLSIEKIRQFEKKCHIKLPEEYVFFLTHVGNGGAGPYYGIETLEQIEKFMESQSEDGEIFLDRNLTIEKWNKLVNEEEEEDDEEIDLYHIILQGALVIGTQGCTYDNILVCAGSEAGKLVYIDWNLEPDYPPCFTSMSFLEWYEQFFKEIIAGNNVSGYGYYVLGTQEEIMEAYNHAVDLEEKGKLLRSLYRFKKSEATLIDFLLKIKDREMDAMRIELLMKYDLSQAIKLWEKLIDGQNQEAAVECARSIPEQYKNSYYDKMLKLLYEENNCNKDKILYFINDCKWKKRAEDIVVFAMNEQISEKHRKAALYVMGNCQDILTYIPQFIQIMKGDSYWLAHTALQAMIKSESKDPELYEAYLWMKEKYKNDSTMRANLKSVINS